MAPATGLSRDDQTIYKGARDPGQGPAPAANRPFDRILALDLKTGEQKQSLMLPETAYSFRLSPDGQTFMLQAQPDPAKPEFYIARMSANGTDYRRLAGPFRLAGVAWTGDSRTIFFGEVEQTATSVRFTSSRVMRLSMNGGAPVFTGMRITGLNALAVNTDGSQIVYSATSQSIWDVWALENISSLFRD
jgi:Tol biopolymer transport system component